LREKLGASLAQAQWIVEAYMLFLTSLMLVGGALGDRWGRRFVFTLGILLFAAASAACGMASDVQQLVIARGAQGIGAALLVPGSLALISANFDRKHRGRAIGTWAAFTSITAGIGPLIGGWLVEHISWRWIFFLNVPLTAAVLLIVRAGVPESKGEPATARIDWMGAALATAGLFGLVFGLIEGGGRGLGEPSVYASLLLGVLCLVAFWIVESRLPHPMMPLSLFRSRTFTGANLLTLFLYCGLGAVMFVLPFALIEAHGYTVVEAAAALMPFIAIMFFMSRWSGGLIDRYGARLPLTLGPAIAGVGFILFSWAGEGTYWTSVLPAVLVMAFAMAITVAPLTTAVMTSVDEAHAGLASGINNAMSRLASLLAVAIVGVVAPGSFETGLVRVAWLSALLAWVGAMAASTLIVAEGRKRSSA
jgi:EmrB/QacA subfamily drug resistance transporter